MGVCILSAGGVHITSLGRERYILPGFLLPFANRSDSFNPRPRVGGDCGVLSPLVVRVTTGVFANREYDNTPRTVFFSLKEQRFVIVNNSICANSPVFCRQLGVRTTESGRLFLDHMYFHSHVVPLGVASFSPKNKSVGYPCLRRRLPAGGAAIEPTGPGLPHIQIRNIERVAHSFRKSLQFCEGGVGHPSPRS